MADYDDRKDALNMALGLGAQSHGIADATKLVSEAKIIEAYLTEKDEDDK